MDNIDSEMPCPRCGGSGKTPNGTGWGYNIHSITCTLCNGARTVSSEKFRLCPDCMDEVALYLRKDNKADIVCITCNGASVVKP